MKKTILTCLLFSSIATLPVWSSIPVIRMIDVTVEKLEDHQVRITFSAESENTEIGSFWIRVERRPEGPLPPNFYALETADDNQSVVIERLEGTLAGEQRSFLIDNSEIDDNPETGTFAYTFNTEGWPEGEYIFRVGAHNRPSDDPHYIRDYRFAYFLVGDKEDETRGGNVPGVKHRIVYQEPGVYGVFPRLHVLPDGRMAVSFGTRSVRSHIDTSGGSAHRVTNDEGKTWEPMREPLVDERWVTKDGSLVTAGHVGWIYVDQSKEQELMDQGKVVNPRATYSGQIGYLGGARVQRSTDGGRTWEFEDIEMPENLRGLGGYSKRASELVTSEGVRLVAVTGSRMPEDGKVVYPETDRTTEVYFLRSEDDGSNWTMYPMVPDGLPEGHSALNETALVETYDGLLIAMSRSQNDDGYLYQSESVDGGLTWSMPEKTAIWGYPAHVLALDENTLICAYGYRRGLMGIRAVMSYDNGATWDIGNEMIIRADALGHPGDNGMPLMHQLSDGSIFMIYYITDRSGITHIASSTFQLNLYK